MDIETQLTSGSALIPPGNIARGSSFASASDGTSAFIMMA
jgi:hypothetical protein